MSTQERIERLERTNRWTWVLNCIVIGAIVWIAIRDRQLGELPTDIDLRTVTIRDVDGEPAIYVTPDGITLHDRLIIDMDGLRIIDDSGDALVRLVVGNLLVRGDGGYVAVDGKTVSMHDDRGTRRSWLTCEALHMADPGGDVQAWLEGAQVTFRSEPHRATLDAHGLRASDRSGKPRVSIGMRGNEPSLALCDDEGRPVLAGAARRVVPSGVGKGARGELVLRDQHGRIRWQAR